MNTDPELPQLGVREKVQRPRKTTNPLVIDPYESRNTTSHHVYVPLQVPRTYFQKAPSVSNTDLFPTHVPSKTVYPEEHGMSGNTNPYFVDILPSTKPQSLFNIYGYGISAVVENMRQL
jgi:hypothetical protein